METKTIFGYLDDFKLLPTYQLERRIDAFMFPYLTAAVASKLNITKEDLVFVYPEFPLRRSKEIEEDNNDRVDKLSEYADYLLWHPKDKIIYLVEFKTDINSIKPTQFQSYINNCTGSNPWETLLKYYYSKGINNSNWRKFASGLNLIENKAKELLGQHRPLNLTKYTASKRGNGINRHLTDLKNTTKFNEQFKVKFIYLAPTASKAILEGYSSSEFYKGLITLKEFAEFADESLKKLLIQIDNSNI